jgi:hypothetical protein
MMFDWSSHRYLRNLRTITGREFEWRFGYRYKLERQDNGWWLVRFPGIPEALAEGETEQEAQENACDAFLICAAVRTCGSIGRFVVRLLDVFSARAHAGAL